MRLVEHACEAAYWRTRLARLIEDGPVSLDAWEDVVPLTAKAATRPVPPQLSSAPGEPTDLVDAGASAGPFRRRDRLSRTADQGMFERICEIHGVPLAATMLDVVSLPTLEHPDWKWNSTFDKASQLSLPQEWPAEFHMEKLVATGAAIVRGRPGTLSALAAVVARSERKPKLSAVVAIGEPCDDSVYRQLATQLAAPVVAIWHDPRLGLIAFRGSGDHGWRTSSATHYVEVIDDNGRACAVGEFGQVAVTPFYSYTAPAVRFLPGRQALRSARPGYLDEISALTQ